MRTVLTAFSIGIPITLILTIVGLSRGMLNDSVRRAEGVGADIWVKAPGTSVISLSAAGMPEKILPWFRQQPHVRYAVGTLIHPIGGISTVSGIDLDEFTKLSGGFRYLEGGGFQTDNDIIIDQFYAEQNNLHVGDKVTIANHQWRVAGVVEPGKLSRIFVPLARLQDLTGNTGKLSQVLIKLDDPANVKTVIAQLKSRLKDYTIISNQELTSLFTVNNVPGLKWFIWVIIGLSVVFGFLVVSLTMYTAVLERTREIGILKAMGASPAYILNILFRETLLLAFCGWTAGVIFSFGSRWAILTFVPASLQSDIVTDWWPIAAGVALAAALLGSFYPGLKAARQDAIEALSYE